MFAERRREAVVAQRSRRTNVLPPAARGALVGRRGAPPSAIKGRKLAFCYRVRLKYEYCVIKNYTNINTDKKISKKIITTATKNLLKKKRQQDNTSTLKNHEKSCINIFKKYFNTYFFLFFLGGSTSYFKNLTGLKKVI